jgi:RNA polymerase sigma-70 factor (ECF subfamily)
MVLASWPLARHNAENRPARIWLRTVHVLVETGDGALDPFRSYLYLLARAHLDPRMLHEVDASDLVQQTLMDAYGKKSQFRGETDAQFAAWLRQILIRNLKDALRHERRAKRDVARQRSLDAAIEDSFRRAESWLAASQSTPSQHFARKEELLRLADALAELPDAQRDAVIFRHLQGMSLAEVASQLDRSESAVAGLVYRGLNKLHDLLDRRHEP